MENNSQLKDKTLLSLGQKIRSLRKERGISAAALGELIGKSRGYITKLENGNCTPSLQALFDLCNYFGIEIKDLFDRSCYHPDLQQELLKSLEYASRRKMETFIYLAHHLVDSVNLKDYSKKGLEENDSL